MGEIKKDYTGVIGFRYRSEIERASTDDIEKIREYSTCNCADGMKKMYTMDAGIKPVVPTHKICGPAVTVRISLGDNLMLHKALGLVKPGDILVVLKIPDNILVAGIVVLCVAGVYASGKNMVDIYIMLIFSFVGYAMERFNFSAVPLVLGFILGPLAEKSLLQAYKIQKSPLNIVMAMMKRPICIVLILVILYILISSFRKSMKQEEA